MHPATALSVRSFRGDSGDTEHYLTIEPPNGLDLAQQIDAVARRYAEALQSLRLTPDTAVFRRLYVSDAANQAALVGESSLCQEPLDNPVAVSLVQQPPLSGAKFAMLAYHLETAAPVTRRAIAPGHVVLEKGTFRHLWSTRLCAGNTTQPSPTAAQTRALFDRLTEMLGRQAGSLAKNCVRTWLYVKDVDVFYQEVNAARTALFEQIGLTRDTHYLASTGIEGNCAHRYDTVLMDAYSILGLQPGQLSYLTAHDRLCDTKAYGVTFERGTRIAYADRAHLLISGTASIDAAGQVMFPGDVSRQLERAVGNVDALLRAGGAGIDAMTHFIVYLRDPSDRAPVEAYFAERFPAVPRLMVRGAVCRPDWLVEVEGVAIAPNHAPGLPAF